MDTIKYKKILEDELILVENEMKDVGRRKPENPEEFEAVETEIDSDHADETDVADNQESFSDNRAILDNLEIQYHDIKDALEKIGTGNYGKCEVGGEAISEDRLSANPSARTCVEHAHTAKR